MIKYLLAAAVMGYLAYASVAPATASINARAAAIEAASK